MFLIILHFLYKLFFQNYDTSTIQKFIDKNKHIDNNKLNTILKYPKLFHKYILDIRQINEPLSYNVVKEVKLTKNICHIHCLKLSLLEQFFDSHIRTISNYFDIIVTFYVNDCNIKPRYKFTFLQYENRGYDIGPKMVAVNYLKNINNNSMNIMI